MRMTMAVLAMLALAGCAQKEGTTAAGAGGANKAPTTEEEKTLYALGLSIGRSVAVFDLTPQELELVKAGLNDQVTGAKPQVELETYGPKLQQLAQARSTARSAKEKEKGKEFLEKAAAEPGATKTESGLVFKSLEEGTGEQPTAADTVKVHYKGTLLDGTEFDSSHKRGEPATFPLRGVIPCWTQGVAMMKVGGKARLVCPPEIAYGERGSPPKIPGGSTLIFEVELLEVTKAAQPPTPPTPAMPQTPPTPPAPAPARKP